MVTVEFTLNANHITGVLAKKSQIAYPSQLLPMLIGLLSLVRIMWLIFRQWYWPEERALTRKISNKPIPLLQFTPEQPQVVGLGLRPMSSPAYSETTTAVSHGQDHSMSIHRPLHLRLLVAWLPWLSQFDFWASPRGKHSKLWDTEDEDARPGNSSSFERRTAYRTTDDRDEPMQSGPSSNTTTPIPRTREVVQDHRRYSST